MLRCVLDPSRVAVLHARLTPGGCQILGAKCCQFLGEHISTMLQISAALSSHRMADVHLNLQTQSVRNGCVITDICSLRAFSLFSQPTSNHPQPPGKKTSGCALGLIGGS